MELIAASQIVRAQNRMAANRALPRGHGPDRARGGQGGPGGGGQLLGTPESIDAGGRPGGRGRPGTVGPVQLLACSGRPSAWSPTCGPRGADVRLFTVGKKAQSYFRFRRPGRWSAASSGSPSGRPSPTPGGGGGCRRALPGRRGRPGAAGLDPLPLGGQPGGRGPPAAALPDPDSPARAGWRRDRTETAPNRSAARGRLAGLHRVRARRRDTARRARAPRPSSRRSSPPCSRGRRRSSPPSSGPWRRPPTTPTS